MGRKRKPNHEELLTHIVRTRICDKAFKRLSDLVESSNCRTICQLARKILSGDRFLYYHVDKSLEAPVEQLILIREELRAIGVNINQITHQFHKSDSRQQRMIHALEVSEEYGKVGDKVEVLIKMVADLGERWLQKSLPARR